MFRVGFCLFLILVSTTFSFNGNDRAIERKDNAGLIAQIKEARGLLKGETVKLIKGTVGNRRVRIGRRKYNDVPIIGIVGREMAIAILDSRGQIRVVRAIKKEGSFEVLTPGVQLLMRRENGINSDIACIDPEGGRIVAVKYPVTNERGRFGSGPEVIEAVYTPYSREIQTEQILYVGMQVMDDLIDKAYKRLNERRVVSHAFPGQYVTEILPKHVLRVLLLNEHIDPSEFKSQGLAAPLAERVLTIIATNREKAYAYSISSAGAYGLVQMIPSTYSRVVKRYPTAGLLPSFHQGMADAVNAVIAQILLCDADWQAIKTRQDIPAERIGPYLAAAYNGGVGRVLSILAHSKEDWMEAPDMSSRPRKVVTQKVPVKVRNRRGRRVTKYVLKSYSQPIFKNETSKYVSQYHWIEEFLVSKVNRERNKKDSHR
jgi:hypothetical protein